MRALKVSEDLLPLTDLKTHASEVIRQVNDTGRPVIVTKHGRGVAIVMSVETFERYEAAAEREALQTAVDAAETQIASGEFVELDDERAKWEAGTVRKRPDLTAEIT